MTTLTEFLLARYAEDEAVARRFHPDESLHVHFAGDAEPTALYTAARVLAECEAKRRIVEHHEVWHGHCEVCAEEEVWGERSSMTAPCPTLRLLALPYADHREFREEWRP